jgi:hypothetical protein
MARLLVQQDHKSLSCRQSGSYNPVLGNLRKNQQLYLSLGPILPDLSHLHEAY